MVATPESFRSVADRFGLSKSNAHVVFKEVICALKEMMPQFVKWPNAEECEINERVIYRILYFYFIPCINNVVNAVLFVPDFPYAIPRISGCCGGH